MRALKNIRLPHYDYSTNGYYFVTIVAHDRKPWLKVHQGLIEDQLVRLNTEHGVRVDTRVIMDNHIHFILVLEESSLPLGELIRRFKATTSRRAGLRIWQPNFYEHVIRNDLALKRIREYIVANPLIERVDCQQFYESEGDDHYVSSRLKV